MTDAGKMGKLARGLRRSGILLLSFVGLALFLGVLLIGVLVAAGFSAFAIGGTGGGTAMDGIHVSESFGPLVVFGLVLAVMFLIVLIPAVFVLPIIGIVRMAKASSYLSGWYAAAPWVFLGLYLAFLFFGLSVFLALSLLGEGICCILTGKRIEEVIADGMAVSDYYEKL